MRKSFYGYLIASLVILVLLLGSFAYGASAKAVSPKAKSAVVQEPQYGGTLTLPRPINPIAWDIAEWTWKHANDTGFYMDHLMMGDLQKGPRGANKFDFQTEAWNPLQLCRPELLESWEVKKNPMQIIFHLRKGIMWQEKPGVMKARELVADDVVYSLNRMKEFPQGLQNFIWILSEKWKPPTNIR